MKKFALALGIIGTAFATAPARAEVPLLNFTCADGISVHADQGGPVYIDRTEAKLEVFNDDCSEASLESTTISIAINTDGTPGLSYTGPGGANGVCTPTAGAEDVGFHAELSRFFHREVSHLSVLFSDQGLVKGLAFSSLF